jgi:hypothetical protein
MRVFASMAPIMPILPQYSRKFFKIVCLYVFFPNFLKSYLKKPKNSTLGSSSRLSFYILFFLAVVITTEFLIYLLFIFFRKKEKTYKQNTCPSSGVRSSRLSTYVCVCVCVYVCACITHACILLLI